MMRVKEFINELRRNPEQNPRVTPLDVLEPLANDKNVFVSYTKLPKLGINPSTTHTQTPGAVYAYPLSSVWDAIKHDIREVPFAGGNAKYLYVFKYPHPILDVSKYDRKDLKKSMLRLHGFFKGLFKSVPYSDDTDDTEAIGWERSFRALMDYTKEMALTQKNLEDPVYSEKDKIGKIVRSYTFSWNKLLQMATGYDAFVDYGKGIIHGNEPTQAMFLNPSKIKIIDRIDLK